SCALLLAALFAGVLSPLPVQARNPWLFVTGLPCPGGLGEPTNSHPLVWQCRCAYDEAKFHPWGNWQDTVPIDYGDVVAVTWFDQCRSHPADWHFVRLDLVTTNQSGALHTNSTTMKMKAGYNFVLSYVYWYTNNGSLFPTNFDVAQVPVSVGPNQ